MEQGTVLEWHVESGDDVEEGQTIAEVESEKSIGEVDAREDGTLRQIYIQETESVPPGTPIGILAAADADISELQSEAESELQDKVPEKVAAESTPGGATETGSDDGGDAATPEPGGTNSADGSSGGETDVEAPSDEAGTEVKASPRAKKRAEELGVDLTGVEGTGFDGAITEEDVERAAESSSTDTESASASTEVKASPRAKKRAEELGVDLSSVEGTGFDGAITEDDVEEAAETASEASNTRWIPAEEPAMDRYRRTTAVADPAAATELVETVEAVRTAFEEDVTTTDVLLAVSSAALADRPTVNGTYAESTHQVRSTQNVALVADVGGETVGGVITGVEGRSLAGLIEARQSMSEERTATEDATFTLANAAEVSGEGRLVNPPGVAALEVDATGQRAVPKGEGVDLHPLVTAHLTYDTRAIGEQEAQEFLEAFFHRAEQASELVLDSYRGTE